MSRWLSWEPPIFGDSLKTQPSKPTEHSFDGSDGSVSDNSQKIFGPEDSWVWIEERAAILEMDGSIDRDTANYRAFMMWFEHFVGRQGHG